MTDHDVVSHEEWIAARKALLEKEKEVMRQRDALSRQIRDLPWERVQKDYVFQTNAGAKSLSDLFDGRSQLIVYHFMLAPGWEEGCKSCSLLADHFDAAIVHVNQRDVSFVVVSRAPLAEISRFQQRMGWQFPWVSSDGTDFNFDYGVSFREGHTGERTYNYAPSATEMDELPGLSVFNRDENGDVFHTYSTYARGLDAFIGAYQFLDIVPKGRDEDDLAWSMEWVRHHDRYEDQASPA